MGRRMRTQHLLSAIGLLATIGCAELAAVAPAVTIDVVATQRRGSAGEGWSWGIGASLAGSLDAAAIAVTREPQHPDRPIAAPPSTPCRIAVICAWEARARARAIVRAQARSREESPQ